MFKRVGYIFNAHERKSVRLNPLKSCLPHEYLIKIDLSIQYSNSYDISFDFYEAMELE